MHLNKCLISAGSITHQINLPKTLMGFGGQEAEGIDDNLVTNIIIYT